MDNSKIMIYTRLRNPVQEMRTDHIDDPITGDAAGSPLLIVGASARAAAASARRRDRRPLAIDLYGDLDLQEIAGRSIRIAASDYPRRIPELARRMPPAPFMVTGGLENHPGIIAELERARVNEGPASSACARVRDPFAVARMLEDAGLPCPRVARSRGSREDPRVWLVKPISSCGGRSIRDATPEDRALSPSSYLQQHIEGVSTGAVFDPDGGRGVTRLAGVTRQLVGETALGTAPFTYSGSVGPIELPARTRALIDEIGATIATAAGLTGLFGIDFVVDAGGTPWPVEVNPRYTASIEVLERAADRRGHEGVLGKAIVYATRPLQIPACTLPEAVRDIVEREDLADIPPPESPVGEREPIVTVFAAAPDVESCRLRVLDIGRRVLARLVAIAGEGATCHTGGRDAKRRSAGAPSREAAESGRKT